jgi:thymidylate synthase (FAD)
VLTEFVWSVNLRSLFNFLSLRAAPNALLEIRLAAEEVERLVEPVCPVTFAAWRDNGRLAP